MQAGRALLIVLCLGLALVTIAVYLPVLSCGFVSLDDPQYVSQNRIVLAGLTGTGWRYAWTSWDCSNWHPLTWLSLELDGCLWGSNPAGYHATNLALHALNCVLLFIVLWRSTGLSVRSALVAAFFALHPLHVESVAWISERKDVLSTSFLLLTLLAYVQYASRSSPARYLLVVLLFALGLLAKPMLVTLPILMLCLDSWPLRRLGEKLPTAHDERFPRQTTRRLLLEKLPLLMLAFADGVMTIVAQFGPVNLMGDVTIDVRIANLFYAYLWYLQTTFIPVNLTVFYPHPERTLSSGLVAAGILVFSTVSAWVWWKRKESPHLLFGWAWFVISLLPVIGLIQVGGQAYADRYAYIPHIGLFTAIVWELSNRVVGAKIVNAVAGVGAIGALVACAMLTQKQIYFWKDSDTLWAHALAVNPRNGFAHAHLADVRMEAGDYTGAIEHIEAGLKLRRAGYVANAYCNWGRCLVTLDRGDEAEEKFLAALKIDRSHEAAMTELAKLLRSQGRLAEATRWESRRATRMAKRMTDRPDNPSTQMAQGMEQARQGRLDQALLHFEKAVQLAPDSAEAHNNLGLVLMQVKRLDEARTHLMRALELNPNLAASHYALGQIFERQSDTPQAKCHYSEALRLNPANTAAQRGLDRLATMKE